MNRLDRKSAAIVVERLSALPTDRAPAWGKLTASELVPHFIGTVRYSMAQLPLLAFTGNWVTTRLVAPVALAGWLRPPKNIKTYSQSGVATPALSWPGDVSTLKDSMEEFIRGCESGRMQTQRHPLFGDLGPAGWSKFHVVHFEHHFRQFGL